MVCLFTLYIKILLVPHREHNELPLEGKNSQCCIEKYELCLVRIMNNNKNWVETCS